MQKVRETPPFPTSFLQCVVSRLLSSTYCTRTGSNRQPTVPKTVALSSRATGALYCARDHRAQPGFGKAKIHGTFGATGATATERPRGWPPILTLPMRFLARRGSRKEIQSICSMQMVPLHVTAIPVHSENQRPPRPTAQAKDGSLNSSDPVYRSFSRPESWGPSLFCSANAISHRRLRHQRPVRRSPQPRRQPRRQPQPWWSRRR
jgi:hypothetical protein